MMRGSDLFERSPIRQDRGARRWRGDGRRARRPLMERTSMSPARTSPSIGLCPLGFLDLSPPRLVELAAEAGFASVGLRTRAATPGGVEYAIHTDTALLRDTRRAVAATGVRVSCVEQIGLFRDTDVAALRPMLEAGAEVGARRVVCSGDDADPAVVAERFAQLCALAADCGMAVDLEFMMFRAVRTVQAAREVVLRSGAANGAIVVDVLHLVRSGGSADDLARLEPRLIGAVQLCDAPLAAPPDLALEARERRLAPGEGALPLAALLDAMGRGRDVDAEAPLAWATPALSQLERARLLRAATARVVAGAA